MPNVAINMMRCRQPFAVLGLTLSLTDGLGLFVLYFRASGITDGVFTEVSAETRFTTVFVQKGRPILSPLIPCLLHQVDASLSSASCSRHVIIPSCYIGHESWYHRQPLARYTDREDQRGSLENQCGIRRFRQPMAIGSGQARTCRQCSCCPRSTGKCLRIVTEVLTGTGRTVDVVQKPPSLPSRGMSSRFTFSTPNPLSRHI
jgi:hypothetical protein